MAVRIDPNNIVRIVNPVESCFTLEEISNHINGNIEPVKAGPIWVMYNEKAKENNAIMNMVASFFFGVPMYGSVLIVPPQQLPKEWEAMDERDERYTSFDVDSGFLFALQNALVHHRVFGNPGTYNEERLKDRITPVEEWTYRPPLTDEIDEKTQDFYNKVYGYISTHPEDFKRNILLSDQNLLIKLENHTDRARVVEQMINFFVTKEEYEKCAFLKASME